MPLRTRWFLLAFVVGLGAAAPARAQKLDKEEKKWLEDVRPILLAEEEKTFKGLKDKADRAEFQKIFWARRDPDLDTPVNEFQEEYKKTQAEADVQFKLAGKPGSASDCGRAYILLGKPDDVKKEAPGANPVARGPEVWTYRDRPGMTFSGGQAQISFDGDCKASPGVGEQLDRLASNKVAQPNIDYRVGKDGKLVKLADLLPKPTPAQALLKAPRQDFPVAGQWSFLKDQSGGTVVIGLVRGEEPGLPVDEAGGKKTATVAVCAQALTEEGKASAFIERAAVAAVQPDGSFLASYRMSLRPGKYTVRAGALDTKTGKGSVAELPVEVPNLNTGALTTTGILILKDVEDLPAAPPPDSPHAFAAYEMGNVRLHPQFGGVFSKSEALSFFYQYYDAKVDEATGKAQVTVALKVLKVGRTQPVASAPDQPFESPIGGSVIGPVPMDKYEPGKYTVQLKITDNVAKKDVSHEVAFELK